MTKKFNIRFSSRDKHKLPISYKLVEYLEDFVIENILKEKKIIIHAKSNILLALMFIGQSKEYESNLVESVLKPYYVSSENLKTYDYILPYYSIKEATNPIERILELVFDSLKLFFSEYYKKVDEAFLDETWKKLDKNYLLGIQYPAVNRDIKNAYTYHGY
ncbi:MAG: hypothetical protein JNL72_04925 [Flavipsychrobacter sp.]|nr:hypothetical protein [Flavipsychrobacter sp.]